MHRFPLRIHAVAAVVLALPACAVPAARPLQQVQLDPLVVCPIPLATARANLQNRGYGFAEENDKTLTTQFKTSDRDTETYLLGSPSIQRERQFRVEAEGDAGVRFSVRYRETRHPHSEDRNSQKTVREYAPPATEEFVPTLMDMRGEVCDSPKQTVGNDPDRRQWDYTMKQCRAGNDEACEALRPR